MYRFRRWSLLLGLALCALPVYAHHLAVVVPAENKAESTTSTELARILKSEMKKWPNGNDVVVVITKGSPTTLQVIGRLCNLPAAEVKALIDAHPGFFIQADNDAQAMAIVRNRPGAVGFVDVHAIDNQLHVLKVDGKLPLELGYLPH
jgi:ABC-type phosphate transport system substrate-binding protein